MRVCLLQMNANVTKTFHCPLCDRPTHHPHDYHPGVLMVGCAMWTYRNNNKQPGWPICVSWVIRSSWNDERITHYDLFGPRAGSNVDIFQQPTDSVVVTYTNLAQSYGVTWWTQSVSLFVIFCVCFISCFDTNVTPCGSNMATVERF